MKKYYRPIIFPDGKYPWHRDNVFQQNILLKALTVTTDPLKLKKMAGIRTMAEVFRTLDKLAIRKEYHDALMRHGLDLDTIVAGIREICDSGKSDAIKLKAYQTILRSLGLANYDDDKEDKGKDWEEVIVKMVEQGQSPKLLSASSEEYEVIAPEISEEDKQKKQAELAEGRGLYE
jgi:phosphosulfolactate synthase (CoM biosynthesis protein A)